MIAVVFRPRRNRINVFLARGWRFKTLSLSLEEAHSLHGALGDTLKIAEMRDDPRAWAERGAS